MPVDPIPGTEIARLTPTPARRGFAVAVLAVLGLLLGWLSFTQPAAPALRVLIAVLALGAGFAAQALARATQVDVILTDQGLFESSGRVIARREDISSVDRGTFAFKPSNGFLIRTTQPLGRAWAPGLWWRLGRQAGFGGVTPSGQGRAMADLLGLHLAETQGAEGAGNLPKNRSNGG